MRKKHSADLHEVERLLAQGLVPVQPDETFVQDMAARLQEPRSFEIEASSPVKVTGHLGLVLFLMGLGLGLFLTGLGLWFWWRRQRLR